MICVKVSQGMRVGKWLLVRAGQSFVHVKRLVSPFIILHFFFNLIYFFSVTFSLLLPHFHNRYLHRKCVVLPVSQLWNFFLFSFQHSHPAKRQKTTSNVRLSFTAVLCLYIIGKLKRRVIQSTRQRRQRTTRKSGSTSLNSIMSFSLSFFLSAEELSQAQTYNIQKTACLLVFPGFM